MTPAGTGKLSGEERRAAILHAVRHLFATKGFKGTTTRELADAAGVSEALLYRHFPTKEDLFMAIQQSFCNDESRGRFERLRELPPATQTLVVLVHFVASQILGKGAGEGAIRGRMLLRSLAEDGEFARLIMQPVGQILVPKIDECLQAAVAAGDAEQSPVSGHLGGWFAYHLILMTSLQHLQDPPIAELGADTAELVGSVVWFVLRGLGLREEAIRSHYQPAALAVLGEALA